MERPRLLADDLTGALDSAARFVPFAGPVPCVWGGDFPAGPLAVDSGTRDLSEAAARSTVERLAGSLEDGVPAFKKIDSLLRGHVAAELAVCLPRFDHCILAPAFPFQGRVTRRGRQLVRHPDGWRDTGVTLPPPLRSLLRDAETDADLAAIVADGLRLRGRVLWCGSGGLAGALAGWRPVPRPVSKRPILALIGSDHPVSVAQVAAVPAWHHRLTPGNPAVPAGRLDGGSAVVTVALPAGIGREAATAAVTLAFRTLLMQLPGPGTLFVAGGHTLRHLCDALDVAFLEVHGEIEPGVPASWMRGGAWDGQSLISKSGAFGDTGFLARLLGDAS